MEERETIRLAKYCEEKLSFSMMAIRPEYRYQSLPLCVIDAVFSMNVKYKGVQNIIKRYCGYFHLKENREYEDYPPIEEQQSIETLIANYDKNGIEYLTDQIYKNHQRSSPKSGILKSEAVYRFAKTLEKFNVNYFQDIIKICHGETNKQFIEKISLIPGQKSGKCLNYFFMLSTPWEYSKNLIKPDRMVLRFLENGLKRKVDPIESSQIILDTCEYLRNKNPELTPLIMDNRIWEFQSNQKD
jgi:hypothetical protein